MQRPPVSVLIIAKNEEKYLPRCLASVSWASEIIVVDSDSTDATPGLCQAVNQSWSVILRYFDRAWTSFKDQRNFALDQASHDWVLVIDADETCSQELQEWIISFFSSAPPKAQWYKVRRQEYFLGQPIHFGIWNPSYQDRFFHKTGIRYVNDVHEYPPYPEVSGRIEAPLHHSSDLGPHKILSKMNRYTEIEARDRYQKGFRTNIIRILCAFPAMFLKNYFYYKAYRDGAAGLVISCLEGISRTVRHIKIWEIQNKGTTSA